MTLPSSFELAKQFIDCIHGYMGCSELDIVRERNELETDPNICHSHDFCDANQAMADALEDWFIQFDANDEAQVALINEAWAKAKMAGFDAAELDDLERCSELGK